MARGHLIVFEGLDRAGKTTQCQLLAAALEADGRKVEFMRFPGTCAVSCLQERDAWCGWLVADKRARSDDADWEDD